MMDRLAAIDAIADRRLKAHRIAEAEARRREVLRRRAWEVDSMRIQLQALADTWAYDDWRAAGGQGGYKGRIPPLPVRLLVNDAVDGATWRRSLRQRAWQAVVSGVPLREVVQ